MATSEKANAADIALYFVHWLTDLAGACPSPLDGCEKFVLQFPQPVLQSFIRSFSIIHRLAHLSETQVMEEYLVERWKEVPELGPVPADGSAIAQMRLVAQVQTLGKQIAVLDAYKALKAEHKQVRQPVD